MSQQLKAEVYIQLSTCHYKAFSAFSGFFFSFLKPRDSHEKSLQ